MGSEIDGDDACGNASENEIGIGIDLIQNQEGKEDLSVDPCRRDLLRLELGRDRSLAQPTPQCLAHAEVVAELVGQ